MNHVPGKGFFSDRVPRQASMSCTFYIFNIYINTPYTIHMHKKYVQSTISSSWKMSKKPLCRKMKALQCNYIFLLESGTLYTTTENNFSDQSMFLLRSVKNFGLAKGLLSPSPSVMAAHPSCLFLYSYSKTHL